MSPLYMERFDGTVWLGPQGAQVPPGPVVPGETRDPDMWPFAQTSIWNLPVGEGRILGPLGPSTPGSTTLSQQFRTWIDPTDGQTKAAVGNINFSTFSVPMHIGYEGDSPLTYRPVEGGTWGPKSSQGEDVVVPRAPSTIILPGDVAMPLTRVNYLGSNASGGSVTFSNLSTGSTWQPDAFFVVIDSVEKKAYESYKTFWAPNSTSDAASRVPNPSGRVLVVRRGVGAVVDLYGDGWTTPGPRASRLGLTGGLIRAWEVALAATNPRAIRHAVPILMHPSQMLRPSLDGAGVWDHPAKVTSGYQWPARARDGHAEDVYRGQIRMGTHFVLDPTWDFLSAGLSPEGIALCWTMLEFGGYVCDITNYGPVIPVEQTVNSAAATRMKVDWQQKILRRCVPILNNTSTDVGGPGARVRSLAPPFELAA